MSSVGSNGLSGMSGGEPKNGRIQGKNASAVLLDDGLRERMHATFTATLRVPVQSVTPVSAPAHGRVKAQVDTMNRLAHLYFKQHVPSWPPRLLLRKLVRKIVFPVLWPQVEYNEAVRDCANELLVSLDQEAGGLRDAQQKIRDLEEKVELLESQILRLTGENARKMVSGSQAAAENKL